MYCEDDWVWDWGILVIGVSFFVGVSEWGISVGVWVRLVEEYLVYKGRNLLNGFLVVLENLCFYFKCFSFVN